MDFERVPSFEISWAFEQFPLAVIAENIHSPYNQGMIIRACESFGVRELFFTWTYSNTDSDKFRKTSRSAEKYLSIMTDDDTISVIQSLLAQQYKIFGLEICKDSKEVASYQFDTSQKYAIIIGAERHGISDLTLKFIDDCIHIRLFGNTGSVNVSMALSIALYELTKQISKQN